jgi:hypothetical protein
MGKREFKQILSADRKLGDQVSTSPKGVCDQSCDRIRLAISLLPVNSKSI